MSNKVIFGNDITHIVNVATWEMCRDICLAYAPMKCNSFDLRTSDSHCFVSVADQHIRTLADDPVHEYGEDCEGNLRVYLL